MKKILLVDDDTEVREAIQEVLERADYEVDPAASARQALRMIEQENYDLIITDVIMPDMNGVDAIKKIREINTSIKIIAISGGGNVGPMAFKPEALTTTAYLKAAEVAGATLTMTKPFERPELVEQVNNIFAT